MLRIARPAGAPVGRFIGVIIAHSECPKAPPPAQDSSVLMVKAAYKIKGARLPKKGEMTLSA